MTEQPQPIDLKCIMDDAHTEPQPLWLNETYEGFRCLFCSPRCRARFEAAPEQFIGEAPALVRPPGYS